MKGRYQLWTHGGELLGTYEGATPAEAIRAMYADKLECDARDPGDTGAEVFDLLVRLWGGRAVCTGSIPAMAAVTCESDTVPHTEREGAS